jgi:hypothetical protein
VTEYRVLFANATPSSINIKAEKVNLGAKKLWFYDAENRLIAVYQWDHLIGFDVVGSPEQQVFTNSLLHEEPPLSIPERAKAIEQRGMLIVLLEDAVSTLNRATDEIRSHWIKINDENKDKTRIGLLVQRHEDTLRELQAKLIDGHSQLIKILNRLQFEFKDMGLPPMPSQPASLPSPTADPQPQGVKKKWFS